MESIGSTGFGTGAAVLSRLARFSPSLPGATQAAETADLIPYVKDAVPFLESALRNGERVVIEGTQGFGLSPFHGDAWPKCTSRDTTAAAMLSETGLSPLHVDEIVLVLRCHPIRVAGDSGPLSNETSWEAIAQLAGAPHDLSELTSVTQKLRRVGHFDSDLVRRAISANAPSKIVLNHIDYVDWESREGITEKAARFVRGIEDEIGQNIDWIGIGPERVLLTSFASAGVV